MNSIIIKKPNTTKKFLWKRRRKKRKRKNLLVRLRISFWNLSPDYFLDENYKFKINYYYYEIEHHPDIFYLSSIASETIYGSVPKTPTSNRTMRSKTANKTQNSVKRLQQNSKLLGKDLKVSNLCFFNVKTGDN